MKPSRPLRVLLLSLACSAALAAQAQSPLPAGVDIPAGDLAAALDAYARQSGIQLIYRADQLRGARTPGARGEPRQAARRAAARQRLHGAPRRRHRRGADRAAAAAGAGLGRTGGGAAGRARRTGCGDRTGADRTADGAGDRLAHSAHAHRGPGADHRDHRRGDRGGRLHQRSGRAAVADPERRRDPEPAVGRRRGLLARRAAGGPARARPEPHPGAGQRPPHRRLPAAVRRPQQLHRRLQPAAGDDRPHRGADRQRLGDLRLGCDLGRGQLHPQEARRRHHRRLPLRPDRAR